MDYFEKKQWIRIAVCAVLVGVIVLAVTGVFSGKESLVYDPAAKNLPAGAVTAGGVGIYRGGVADVLKCFLASGIQDAGMCQAQPGEVVAGYLAELFLLFDINGLAEQGGNVAEVYSEAACQICHSIGTAL